MILIWRILLFLARTFRTVPPPDPMMILYCLFSSVAILNPTWIFILTALSLCGTSFHMILDPAFHFPPSRQSWMVSLRPSSMILLILFLPVPGLQSAAVLRAGLCRFFFSSNLFIYILYNFIYLFTFLIKFHWV